MTFGSLWGPATQPGPVYHEYYPSSKFFAGERGDMGGGYPYGGMAGNMKSSKKADKKQAAMSALTLIAFLFFLNILQSCLQEHMEEPTTATIMMVNTPIEGRNPNISEIEAMGKYEETLVDKVEPQRKEDTTENLEQIEYVRVRKLLSIEDEDGEREGAMKRDGKFIHNFEVGKKDWTNELSQVSDEDLKHQKQKLDQLRQLWKRRKVGEKAVGPKNTLEDEVDRLKVKKFINSPVLADLKGIPKLSQYWLAQKTSTQVPETKSIEFEEPAKKVADFGEFEAWRGERRTEKTVIPDVEPELVENVAQSLQLTSGPIGEVEEVHEPYGHDEILNTPRYRRSDELLTTLATEELFRPEAVPVTPNPTLIPTTKTYHVYTHPSQIHTNMWRTTTPQTSTKEPATTEKMPIHNIYFTTSKPTPPPSRYHHNHRPQYRPLSRYRYSPNRRVAYEAPVVRQEYYPMSVVGQYGGEDDSGTLGGVVQLVWNLLSSFARPISRIIPQMSKVGGENQCLELLACEAHRVGNLMGPTAKAVATTFSTLLVWVTSPLDKPALDEAVIAGKENSCSHQIAACDEKSGGKSLMTVIAQLMELRPENKSRDPRK